MGIELTATYLLTCDICRTHLAICVPCLDISEALAAARTIYGPDHAAYNWRKADHTFSNDRYYCPACARDTESHG